MRFKILILTLITSLAFLSSCSKSDSENKIQSDIAQVDISQNIAQLDDNYQNNSQNVQGSKLELMQFDNSTEKLGGKIASKIFRIKDNLNLSTVDSVINETSNMVHFEINDPIMVNSALYIVIKSDRQCDISITFYNQKGENQVSYATCQSTKFTKIIVSMRNFVVSDIDVTGISGDKIVEIGVDKDFAGFLQTDTNTTLNSLITYKNAGDSLILSMKNPIIKDYRIHLNYLENGYNNFQTFLNHDDPTMSITFSNAQKSQTKKFEFFPSAGQSIDLDFYYEDIGFIPAEIMIKKNGHGFFLNSMVINPFKKEKGVPVRKDLGLILKSPITGTKYDLYSWNLFPDILVFDFADYNTQALYLKRLAFFIEKKGYIGMLLSNQELSGKHGWNAHDYSAKSLSSFFTKASVENFKLNKEEYELLDILLSQGILIKQGNTYKPQKGAIVSISKESTPSLRREFLSHEIMHGIYFVHDGFVQKSKSCFEDLSRSQRKAIVRWFEWYSYNPNDDDLMANEFQAYTLQQPIDEIKSNLDDKVKARLSELGMSTKEDLFNGECAYILNDYMYETFGIYGDGVYQVLPVK